MDILWAEAATSTSEVVAWATAATMVIGGLVAAIITLWKGRGEVEKNRKKLQQEEADEKVKREKDERDNRLKIEEAERRGQQRARKDALTEWQEIAHRNEESARKEREQSERRDALIHQLQQVIHLALEEHGGCREEVAELRAGYHYLQDYAKRTHAHAKSQGIDLGEPPAPPPIREHTHHEESKLHYLMRQADQSADLLRKVDRRIEKINDPNDEESTTPLPPARKKGEEE